MKPPGGIQRDAEQHALRVLDEAGAVVLVIPLQNDDPMLADAVAYQVGQSLLPGFTLDRPAGANGQAAAAELFNRGSMPLPGVER